MEGVSNLVQQHNRILIIVLPTRRSSRQVCPFAMPFFRWELRNPLSQKECHLQHLLFGGHVGSGEWYLPLCFFYPYDLLSREGLRQLHVGPNSPKQICKLFKDSFIPEEGRKECHRGTACKPLVASSLIKAFSTPFPHTRPARNQRQPKLGPPKWPQVESCKVDGHGLESCPAAILLLTDPYP